MGNTRNTGYLQNAIKVSDAGAISFMSGSTMLATINTTGQMSGSSPVLSSSYALNADLLDGLDSTQFTLTSSFAAQTASFTAFTASVNSFTASQLVLNGTYATTGSNTFNGIQTVNSNLIVTGSITAQTLVVQTITSSVDFVTGSTRFGSVIGNTHVFTGSIFTSGSVNIGTPSSMSGVTLNVLSVPNAAGIVINNSSSVAYTGLRVYNDQASAVRALEIDYAGSTYGSALMTGGITGESAAIVTTGAYPLQFGTSNTFRMCILSGGNVGIGTTNPTAKFEIQNAPANDWGISVWGNTTTGQSYGGIIRGGTNSSDVAFRVNNAANNTTYFTVQGNGYVGINTNNPTSPLYIAAQSDSVGGDGFRLGNSAISRIWNTRFATTDLSYNLDFYDGASWNNRLKLSYPGVLTVPSQVSFKAYLSANINPTKSTNVTVPYNVEEYDTQGNYSTSTYKFTAPVAGKYLFTVNFNAYGLDDTAYLRVMLLLNASTVRTLFLLQNMPTGNTGDVNVSGADVLNLSAGNTVEVRVYTDGSGTFGMSQNLDWNSFSGHLLG